MNCTIAFCMRKPRGANCVDTVGFGEKLHINMKTLALSLIWLCPRFQVLHITYSVNIHDEGMDDLKSLK